MCFVWAAIKGIAEQGMTGMRHVYADLMGAPGFQSTFEQCRIVERLQPAKMRCRMLPATGFHNLHFLAIT